MIFSFTIPRRDYASIKQYLKRGRTADYELIGRQYEVVIDVDIVGTAEVLADKQAIVYSVSYGDQVFQKTVSEMSCRFENLDIVLAFDIDAGYE